MIKILVEMEFINQRVEEKIDFYFVKCLERSKITYDKVLNQYNTKVWVFQNVNQEKIDAFKKILVEK